MKLAYALLAASMLAAPAFADPLTGPYVSLGAGVTQFMNQPINRYGSAGPGFNQGSYNSATTDAGIAGTGAVGWGLGNGLRVELQGLFQQNKVNGFGNQTAQGHFEQYSGFGNVLYDFNLDAMGVKWPGVTPYIGAGVGYADTKWQGVSAADAIHAGTVYVGSSKSSFAVQGIVGAAFDVSAVPGLAVTAEYHFGAVPDSMSYHATFTDANGTTSSAKFRTNGEYSHTATLGLRYALWQPKQAPAPVAEPMAPPPVVAAPPAPVVETRTYLVFFDWDRADLTARAKQIVAEAATASTHVATTRIEVNGYTDLSGTAAYNQRLSVRRAESVEAELVKDGVAQNEIAIHGYGESNPLVPTAKGVREPQNRRVEIILK